MNNGDIFSAGGIGMRYCLFISKHYDADDFLSDRHLRFAVVDLAKGKNYPCEFRLFVANAARIHRVWGQRV